MVKITITRIKRAIRQSIAHWEKVVTGDHSRITSNHCPLCKLFGEESCCQGDIVCPLARKLIGEFSPRYDYSISQCDEGGPWKKLFIHWKTSHDLSGKEALQFITGRNCRSPFLK